MPKPYVYITRKLDEASLTPLKEVAHVEMWPSEDEPCPREELETQAAKADALLTMLSDQIDEPLLSKAPNIKVVANLAVGYDNIDLEAAKKHGITVCHTPDVLTESTADLAFALLMASARRIVEASDWIKNGNWTGWGPLLLAGADVHHKTLGIVGMGSIGTALAKRAKGFNMNVLYHNRSRKPEAEAQLGVTYAAFEELLKQSDFIVCLTPLTPETKDMFNEKAFDLMKNSAYFINVSRGQTVDEDALYEAVTTGKIAGAGLDVFRQEPVSPSHPLTTLRNVTVLPHIGSASVETRKTMMRLCAENIALVLQDEPAKTPVRL
ncbi:D-isomer specific 2-hydroxyacid dehydrogenase [Bacillus safensis FO-36b]|uniref:2-hydroxyacid dehydrogenase n=1 Tax=Bacillus TaxID=1386 RepID=UPI00045C9573|nr:D-glycerate dehydrogenase [Bacillus safensis]AWI38062.1 D-glycerate dehydrogenase [Bacillus safensis FO-36b]KDE26988.1 D-isomer specific 2-hydroxyacid dehydrogenase [Bacillus safensis FO-36b]MCM3048063.1 D-glycerate dehydrogenase [Bacillus safensis]MEC0983080.1 D-glycerate dehydrogenase [Bacillus safensis]MEC1046564.1 D-glycerate dehydrogenase [Bacillus safensis]